MKLYFATEARFVKRSNQYYSLGGFSKELWNRYLSHFSELIVLARVTEDPTIEVDDTMLASCPRVTFIDLPYYIGFTGYLLSKRKILNILYNKLQNDGCFICRLPGQIGGSVITVLLNKGIPYSCEVVGNPWDVFARGSVNHPFRPLIRIISTNKLKRQVKQATACMYVTQKTLQQMYPVKEGAFSVGVSDVIVKESVIAKEPKVLVKKDYYTLISVGSLAQMYKAPDIVLASLAILKSKGYNINLIWLGDGKYKQCMVELACKLDVSVDFKGNVSSDEVHHYLMESDIFMLVSRTEGLPRAVVEAMAHGLPCIGTRVGGIPELLENSVLIDKENPEQLAILIEKMILCPEFANNQARRNLNESLLFKENRLELLRNSFFEHVKSQYYE